MSFKSFCNQFFSLNLRLNRFLKTFLIFKNLIIFKEAYKVFVFFFDNYTTSQTLSFENFFNTLLHFLSSINFKEAYKVFHL